MITTGIVKDIVKDINNTTIYKVDIPIFRTPGFTKDAVLFDATASVNPGTYNPYKIDDLVYVGFVNNKYSQPLILGKIYKNLPEEGEESSTYQFLNSIRVTENAELPMNTTIGDLTLQELLENIKTIQLNSDNLVILSQGGKNKYLHSNKDTGVLEWADIQDIVGPVADVQMPNGYSLLDGNIAKLPDYGISYDDENISEGYNEPNTNLFRTWIKPIEDSNSQQTRGIVENGIDLETRTIENEKIIQVSSNEYEGLSIDEKIYESPERISNLESSDLEGLDIHSKIID